MEERASSIEHRRQTLGSVSIGFGLLAAVGPVTLVFYPWAFGFGLLALATGLMAGWQRAKTGIILGILCPVVSLVEILVARALN